MLCSAFLLYIVGGDNLDLKPPISFEEQLNKLEEHGIIVGDREKAIEILKNVNYYRFTGYAA